MKTIAVSMSLLSENTVMCVFAKRPGPARK